MTHSNSNSCRMELTVLVQMFAACWTKALSDQASQVFLLEDT